MPQPRMTYRAAMVLFAGFMVLFVGGGSRFAIGLTLKPMVEEFGWNRGTLGIAAASFLIISALCMYFAGRLADRFSLRLILGGGLAISALGIGFMGYVQEPWHAYVLYGGVFAIGSGIASLPPVAVMVTRWFPTRSGFANAVAISGTSAGQLIMIGILTVILTEIGWRSVYSLLGIATAAMIPVLFLSLAHDREHAIAAAFAAPPSNDMTVREAFATNRFRLLALMYVICGFQDFFMSTHVVAFAQDTGVNDLLAGNLLAFMGLTGLIGVFIAGGWSDRSGPIWVTLACFLLRAVIFWLVIYNKQAVSVAVFALLFGSTFMVTAPLTVIFVRDAFGLKNLGALSGLITMIHHMAGGLGAYYGAVMFDLQGNYDLAFAVLLALSLIAAVITLALNRKPDIAQIS